MMTYDDHKNVSGSGFKKLAESLLSEAEAADNLPVEKRKMSVKYCFLKNLRKEAAPYI